MVASVDRVHEHTPGQRVQRVYDTTPDGLRWREPYVLYDSQFDAECVPTVGPNGEVRCMNPGYDISIEPGFSDPACTNAIELASAWCGLPALPRFVSAPIGSYPGDPSWRLRSIGPPYSGTLYQLHGSSCTAVEYPDTTWYEFGRDVDWTELPLMTTDVDP
jgi:hypothetical protein